MPVESTKRNRTLFLVLLALSNESMHGYEISKFIETKTNGFFRLPFGSLYPVLHKMEADKLIQSRWDTSGSQKPRKTYSLTPSGKSALREEMGLFRGLYGAIRSLAPTGLK